MTKKKENNIIKRISWIYWSPIIVSCLFIYLFIFILNRTEIIISAKIDTWIKDGCFSTQILSRKFFIYFISLIYVKYFTWFLNKILNKNQNWGTRIIKQDYVIYTFSSYNMNGILLTSDKIKLLNAGWDPYPVPFS